jgi:hypothetical protein
MGVHSMKTRRISYVTYCRNESFWLCQHAKGVEIEVHRMGDWAMTLHGEPEVCVETSMEKLRRNRILLYPRRPSGQASKPPAR